MGKMILGGTMMVFGLFLSFVPPFIFGPILFVAGLGLGCAGMFGATKDAAKATAAGVKAVQNYSREQDLARRERELAEREQAIAGQTPKTGA
jgi:hypothetical protein